MDNVKGPSLSEAIFLQIPELKDGFKIKVGIASGSKYPDGQSVAEVAYWNEVGTAHIPARPTFSIVPFKYGDDWSKQLEAILKRSGWKVEQSLESFGNMVAGQVKMEINNLWEPSLALSTIKIRERKYNNFTNKPLIVTGMLFNSVISQVEKK